MKLSVLVTAAAGLISSTAALGINCRGSGFCSLGASGNLINLKALVDEISPRNRHYSTGEQIACSGDICAFFQKGASGSAEEASALLQKLRNHGCKKCGSVPTGSGNNVDNGELTVNYVSSPCSGIC
ncbi:killer toxin, kp4 [Grosmannia clavigera kw1407]|uniref:Killer toxin, kp4 n=1 Tax=Grosmannia clavigera (strain kw1407 / UAMH 11150) TaxID=655863 RepID=F0X719_GROCL|nr:killer toxin, kp4 [Grosmannia clavigera kw1407]EFX06550.1 killer toxin, kp4 [Grosmannia clavigera kw1407]